ncbi:MAG: hypothetical protein JWR16_142 [Nevskia sp.]|nr:hypothetical protein [Nevskia sp.]
MLPAADWLAVVRNAPLVSIDLILVDPAERILLGWRNNEPARNTWFVPGGAIRKSERLDDAFRRIAQTELGLQLERRQAQLLGVYEHFYDSNFAGATDVGTHYVVMAYRCAISQMPTLADAQHHELRWFSRDELFAEPAVHANTRAYFVAS